jgi:hypothetical protein
MPVRVVAEAVVREEREPVTEEVVEVARVVLALLRQAPLLCLVVFPLLPLRLLRWAGRAEVVATPTVLTQAALNGAVAAELAPEPQTTSALLVAAVCTEAVAADVALA